jgi:hypothetical protein
MGKIEQFAIASAPMPAVARVLSRYDREKVEAFIEVAIGLLDTFDGPDDPDTPDFSARSDAQPGDPADHERGGDEEAGAYVEWTSMLPAQRRRGLPLSLNGLQEGDEAIGDEQDGDGAEDEECAWFRALGQSAGCPVADPGGCEHDGSEPEEQAFCSYGIDQTHAVPETDPTRGREMMNQHRDRIRATRCIATRFVTPWGERTVRYTLRPGGPTIG